MQVGLAPYNATGHDSTCRQVRPMQLPAFFDHATGRCVDCGGTLMWPGKVVAKKTKPLRPESK